MTEQTTPSPSREQTVWLLWEHESYEPSTLHGVFGSKAAAEHEQERIRRQFRKQEAAWVGADDVYPTRAAAYAAVDARIASDFLICEEPIR